MVFVLGVFGFSTVSGAVENACFPTMGNVYCTKIDTLCTLLENTEILNFVLLSWAERNSGRYEHARACRARARRARHKTQSFTAIKFLCGPRARGSPVYSTK
jgi:hypothetical protein